jgi:hypothetical protein
LLIGCVILSSDRADQKLSEHNQIGDIATLDRIAIIIGNRPGSSKEGVSDKGVSKPEPKDFVLECTQLCNTLAQTTTLLDPKLPSDPGSSQSTFSVRG